MTAWLDTVIDLSHWQRSVDFAAVKSAGVLAVLLKATQGSSYVDPTFSARADQALALGLLVGAYHFADASDTTRQTTRFLGTVGQLPVALALDIEKNSVLGGTVTLNQAAQIVSNVHSAVSRLPFCYTGRWGPDGHGRGFPNDVLSRCYLWLPEYGANPIPPPGWDHATLWQWTSKGSCAGVGSPCDRNRFAGSADELFTFWKGST